MSDLTVAKTIASQMGGTRKLSLFIGANNFAGDDNSLSFHFKGSRKASMVKITLNSLDTYDVKFYKRSKGEAKMVLDVKGIYDDMLKGIFETATELYLSF